MIHTLADIDGTTIARTQTGDRYIIRIDGDDAIRLDPVDDHLDAIDLTPLRLRTQLQTGDYYFPRIGADGMSRLLDVLQTAGGHDRDAIDA